MRGFGAATTGSSAAVTTVTTLPALRTAAKAGGKNIKVDVPVGTIWNLAGTDLVVRSNTTLDYGNLTTMGATAPKVTAGVSNCIFRNVRNHAGDQYGNPDDVDGGNVNAVKGPVRHLYFANCQFLWGPDVTFAVLDDVADVTFERCVFAEGLYNSNHSESPHALGPNLDCLNASGPNAARVSFIECLISTCQGRNPRFIGSASVEVIGTTIYNFNEAAHGAPLSASFLGCTWKKGPNPLADGKLLFRAAKGGHCNILPKSGTVYIGKRLVIGFTDGGADPKVRATAPRFTSTEPEPDPATAHATVLDSAGAQPADKQLTRVLNNVRNGTGHYVNGYGKAGSYTGLL